MTAIKKAFGWAAAMLALALGVAAGFLSESAAEPFFWMIPVLAVVSLSNNRCCTVFARRKA